jgi:general secretion pathway protein A
LKIAGRPDSNVFSAAAIKRVFRYSGGVPRRINLICDRAMLTAFTEERGVVSARDVDQAVKELDGTGEGFKRTSIMPWKFIGFAAALIVCVVVVGLFAFSRTEQPVAEVTVKTQSPDTDNRQISQVVDDRQDVVQKPPENTIVASINALLATWDAPPLDDSVDADALDIEQEFLQRGFKMFRLAGSFEDIIKYNVPSLLPLKEADGGYLAVLGKAGVDQWLVAPGYNDKEFLSTAELNRLGMRVAFVPWVDFASIGYVAVPGVKGENVRRLQFLLGLTGCADVSTNGLYDRQTIECVKEFQRANSLMVDGLVGPRTLMLLYQIAGAYDMPKLS